MLERPRLITVFAFLGILACFLTFAIPATQVHFAPDDMMNMEVYWRKGLWTSLADCLRFWSTAYRPFGALYYLPIYRIFGLHPLPYRMVILAAVLSNVLLSYALAWRLTKSRLVTFFTAIFLCAHATFSAGTSSVYYANSSLYDIFALFFSLLLLAVYARIRERGELPGAGQTILLFALFIAAVDSKEIAVVTPGYVLAYELFFQGFPKDNRWPFRQGRAALVLLAAAALYTVGKLHGPGSLAQVEGYQVHISWDRYVKNNCAYLSSILYARGVNSSAKLIVIYVILLVLMWKVKTPAIRWSSFYALTATLPISFIPMRGGASLALPLFGWLLLICSLALALGNLISRSAWGRVLIFAALSLVFTIRTIPPLRGQQAMVEQNQALTRKVITQFQQFPFKPKPGSNVLVLNEPFGGVGWDTYFIAELVWNDPSVHITLSQKLPAPPQPSEIAQYDSVIAFDDRGEIRLVPR